MSLSQGSFHLKVHFDFAQRKTFSCWEDEGFLLNLKTLYYKLLFSHYPKNKNVFQMN